MPKVSTHYKLGRTQGTLEFVDVDVRNDSPLFIDPGAVRLLPTQMAHECASLVQSFFTQVLTLMQAGKHDEAQLLLAGLGEPNETHLGLSDGKSSGHGMGDGLAEALWKGLQSSKAVQTGLLRDLEETALFIDGIDRDIISDIVTNIIRGPLARYTEQMCAKYSIPVTANVPVVIWDSIAAAWTDQMFSLPIVDGMSLLLVPRAFVRRRRGVYAADKYYRHFVIPFLQSQHFNSNSNMVRLLADGKTRRPPYKKTLMGMYPEVKALNTSITEQDPNLLDKYRKNAKNDFTVVSHEDLAKGTGGQQPDFDQLLTEVTACNAGDKDATKYHLAVEKLLTALFYPALDAPVVEQDLHDGRKRIDIDYTNIAQRGFFHWLHSVHGVQCSFVPVECKNYSKKLTNKEYDQLSGRFGVQRGFVGILCYRGFVDKKNVLQHCRDASKDGRGYIIALDDDDLAALVQERKGLEDGENFETIWSRFKELVG